MLRTISVLDSVEKEVVPFGNGSIVYTPKRWIGEKVLVILEEKPLDIDWQAMQAIKPFLGSVQGVFLFGSFARGEQTEKSDIDVMVITDKKIGLKKQGRLDFLVKTMEELEKEIEKGSGIFLQQAIMEAKPIMNERLLEELRRQEKEPDFGKFLDDTIGAFKKTKESLERAKKKEFLESNASIYSLVLRLKTMLIVQCRKKSHAFSNKKFREMLLGHGFEEKTVNDFLSVFAAEREEQKTGIKIRVKDAEKLFEAAKTEFVKTEGLVKK